MSGYAIARELREQHSVATPLVIAISGVWTRIYGAARRV
jgi:hypothetical protein